jgi:hypothetical protein
VNRGSNPRRSPGSSVKLTASRCGDHDTLGHALRIEQSLVDIQIGVGKGECHTYLRSKPASLCRVPLMMPSIRDHPAGNEAGNKSENDPGRQ